MEKLNSDGLYSESFIELYKSSSNFGSLKNFTHQATESNSVCGDEFSVQLLVDKGKIEDIKFGGSGCILSTVAASLLSSKIKGKRIEEIKKIKKEEIEKLFKKKITSSRTKCILLPFKAVKKALEIK